MKKQLLALTLVFVMLLGVATQAAGPMRAPSVKPELSYVVNIYAKATTTGRNGMVYTIAQQTNHHTRTASALADKAYRRWDASPVDVKPVGLARTRYTDNTVSEKGYVGYAYITLGGRNRSSTNTSLPATNIPESKSAAYALGDGLGNNMVSVIQQVFSYDLSKFQYVCFEDVWTGNISDKQEPLLDILVDRFDAVKPGERLPLGFLYQDNLAFTVVEQPDGSLELTRYSLTSPSAIVKNSLDDGIGHQDSPLYSILETENHVASKDVVASLYQ